jgi:acyl carrier protein
MKEKIENYIITIVKDIGEELGDLNMQNFTRDSPILGTRGSLDSLSLTRLISELEEKISREYNKKIEIFSENSLGEDLSSFKNVFSLAERVEKLLKQT